MSKLPIIGVMGSSERDNADLAAPLGALIARLGAHLLTGAGQASMAAVAQAFVAVKRRKGLSIGIAPAASLDHPTEPREGYPNAFVEVPILTHLLAKQPDLWDGLTRNHINILSSTAVVALPGSYGTRHEIELCVKYGKPIATFFHNPDEMGPLPAVVRQCCAIEAIEAFLREHLGEGDPQA